MTDTDLTALLRDRFDESLTPPANLPAAWHAMAARGSCRAYAPGPVDPDLVRTLCALALAAPTKSDLQQRDIVLLTDPARRATLADLVGGQAWVRDAPGIAIFCGNNRRQRLIHDWRGRDFVNDHLDAFFNAAVDAGIALAAFVIAAEAAGLGCCPISAVRNEAAAVSDLLGLPDRVFPVAGLAFGYPGAEATLSPRLPLRVTVHRDRYLETDLRAEIDAYDARRAAMQPYAAQRRPDLFGTDPAYGWSEDKARQYSLPERADFGAHVRRIGFSLD
ncbi:MAG: nitroreductase family protein [Jannaschia sp.]